jgi:hypothetical protein
MLKHLWMLTLAALMGLPTVACKDEPAEPDSEETVGEEVEEAAEDTGEAFEEAGEDTEEAIDEAGE